MGTCQTQLAEKVAQSFSFILPIIRVLAITLLDILDLFWPEFEPSASIRVKPLVEGLGDLGWLDLLHEEVQDEQDLFLCVTHRATRMRRESAHGK